MHHRETVDEAAGLDPDEEDPYPVTDPLEVDLHSAGQPDHQNARNVVDGSTRHRVRERDGELGIDPGEKFRVCLIKTF